MSRLKTESDFLAALDEEFAWRLKEIDDLKKTSRSASSVHQKTLIRAGVALLYAHWEGFVKSSSELYLNYLSSKKIPYQKLQRCLVAFGLKGHLANIEVSGKAETNMAAVGFIIDNLDKPAKLPFKDSIETGSNLSSANFKVIVDWIGIDVSSYAAYNNFIDSSLLARRNKVAHGESIDVAIGDYVNLTDKVIVLMRMYKTDLENSVINKKYLLPQMTASAT